MRLILVLACLTLAACGTPQDRCVRATNREAATLDRLITETQEAMTRGYRIETELRDSGVTWGVAYCNRSRNIGFCFDNDRPRTVRRAVPIDPEAERRKLANLRERRAALADRSCLAS